MSPQRLLLSVFLSFATVSCGGSIDAGESEDNVDDSFFHDGKTDGADVPPQSDVACAILKLVNVASEDVLHDQVGLGRHASQAISAWRRGADGNAGTTDDRWFTTLQQLDDVPWVGPIAFFKLWWATRGHDEYRCGDQNVKVLAINDFH